MERFVDGKFKKLHIYDPEDICKMYLDGLGSTAIARKYNMSAPNVCKILHDNNIPLRQKVEIELNTDQNFLSYFYGVMLGDGHLVKNKRSNQIAIASSDYGHLVSIQQFIKHGKILSVGANGYSLTFCSEKYTNWMLELGCTKGNKSKSITFPSIESSLNLSLVLLGLIDTDGCWYQPKITKGKVRGYYFSVSKENMIDKLCLYLDSIGIMYSVTLRTKQKESHSQMYCLNFLDKTISKVVDHIYKDAYGQPFLIRKFKKVESLMDSTLFAKLKPSDLV